MIWKIVAVLSIALYVQSEEDAISDQRIVIHHHKFDRGGSLSHIGQKKSGNQEEYAHAYPSYEFSYKVNDPETLDIKGQHETREGDEVTGNYWLVEPNGRKRTVNYQANDDMGFNAQIIFTAALKDKDTVENTAIHQPNVKENYFEDDSGESETQRNVDEAVQEIENGLTTMGDSPNEPGSKESNLKEENDFSDENNSNEEVNVNEDNNQSDNENNNIGIVNNENANRITKENIAESSQKATSHIAIQREICCVPNLRNQNKVNRADNLNKPRRRNRPNNVSSKNNRNSLKKNKNQYQIPLQNVNKNSLSEHINENRVKQNVFETNVNNNIGTNKQKRRDRSKNLNTSNRNINGELRGNQEQNSRKSNELYKNDNSNSHNDVQHNNNFAVIKLTPNDDKVLRKIDDSDNSNKRETFEHSIRIYHPKTTPNRKALRKY